jgi:hypothetical protein
MNGFYLALKPYIQSETGMAWIVSPYRFEAQYQCIEGTCYPIFMVDDEAEGTRLLPNIARLTRYVATHVRRPCHPSTDIFMIMNSVVF